MKEYDDMTKEERVVLMLTDLKAYMDIIPVTRGYWFQILDGIGRTSGITEDE